MNIGPLFSDPIARGLYAEIASIEEQHVTQFGSLMDPHESMLEKLLIHETMQVYAYYSCVKQETNRQIKAIWERFLDYKIGQLNYVCTLFENFKKRDARELLNNPLPPCYRI